MSARTKSGTLSGFRRPRESNKEEQDKNQVSKKPKAEKKNPFNKKATNSQTTPAAASESKNVDDTSSSVGDENKLRLNPLTSPTTPEKSSSLTNNEEAKPGRTTVNSSSCRFKDNKKTAKTQAEAENSNGDEEDIDDAQAFSSELSILCQDKSFRTPLHWYFIHGIFAETGPFCSGIKGGLNALIEKHCTIKTTSDLKHVKDRIGKLRRALILKCFRVLECKLVSTDSIAELYKSDPFLLIGDANYLNISIDMGGNTPVPKLIEQAVKHAEDSKSIDEIKKMASFRYWYRWEAFVRGLIHHFLSDYQLPRDHKVAMESIVNYKAIARRNIFEFLMRKRSNSPAGGINLDILKPTQEEAPEDDGSIYFEDFNDGVKTDTEDFVSDNE